MRELVKQAAWGATMLLLAAASLLIPLPLAWVESVHELMTLITTLFLAAWTIRLYLEPALQQGAAEGALLAGAAVDAVLALFWRHAPVSHGLPVDAGWWGLEAATAVLLFWRSRDAVRAWLRPPWHGHAAFPTVLGLLVLIWLGLAWAVSHDLVRVSAVRAAVAIGWLLLSLLSGRLRGDIRALAMLVTALTLTLTVSPDRVPWPGMVIWLLLLFRLHHVLSSLFGPIVAEQHRARLLLRLWASVAADPDVTFVLVDADGRLLPGSADDDLHLRGPTPALSAAAPEPLATLAKGQTVRTRVGHNPWTGRSGSFYLSTYLIHDENGRTLGAAAFYRDRTLEQRAFRERAWQERVAAMGQTAASVAHELRNPLMAISGYLQLLEREPLALAAGERWTIVRAELDRINHIINRFLQLATPSRPELDLVNLRDLTETVLGNLPPVCPNHVRFHIEVPTVTIRASAARLTQVLYNLVANAIEAVNGAGNIVIWAAQYGQDLWLAVENDGPQLSEETMSRLFEPFYSTKPQSLGLGLSLSRQIVEEHGGRLVAENFPGGVRFMMRLPLPVEDRPPQGRDST